VQDTTVDQIDARGSRHGSASIGDGVKVRRCLWAEAALPTVGI
jgi:hypothetical protein